MVSLPALFAEWDHLSVAEQLEHLQQLQDQGLPEPTGLVTTRDHDGSVHAWWRLDPPLAGPEGIQQWRTLIARLIAVCKSDPACKNPSRLMRLAGSSYIPKAGRPGEGTVIGQARLIQVQAFATHSPATFEAWVESRFAADPQLAASLPAVASPAPTGRRNR